MCSLSLFNTITTNKQDESVLIMKRKIMKHISILLLAFIVSVAVNGQVEFRKVLSAEDMDQVWVDAAEQNKNVFVDIYATWCGPCKWLDANVFSREEAGEYMNREFINVKMDGESEFGRVFALESGLSAYPSLFLFTPEKKLMNMLVGAKPWEELYLSMSATIEYFPVLEGQQQKYESGKMERKEYPAYVNALRMMGKKDFGYTVAGKYKKEFLKDEDPLTQADLQVLAFFTPPSSSDWNRLTSDIPALKKALGKDVESFVDQMVSTSIELAVEENDFEIITNMSELLPGLTEGTSLDSLELKSMAVIYFYHYTDQMGSMINYIDREYSGPRNGDHNWLFHAASSAVFLDPSRKEVAQKGLEWFKDCIALQPSHEYYYHLALCEYFTDSPEKAVNSLTKSLEYTSDQAVMVQTLSIIDQIKAEAGLND